LCPLGTHKHTLATQSQALPTQRGAALVFRASNWETVCRVHRSNDASGGGSLWMRHDRALFESRPVERALVPGRRVYQNAISATIIAVDTRASCSAECPPASLREALRRGNAPRFWVTAVTWACRCQATVANSYRTRQVSRRDFRAAF
jgi:hypothetical protein